MTENEIRSGLDLLLANARAVSVEGNENSLNLVDAIKVQLPLTPDRVRGTIKNLREQAEKAGIDFSEFDSYEAEILKALEEKGKDTETIKPGDTLVIDDLGKEEVER